MFQTTFDHTSNVRGPTLDHEPNVGPVEIVSLAEQRFAREFRRRVGLAVAEIQPGRVTTLAVSTVVPSLTILPYEVATARVQGQIRAILEAAGKPLADVELQIAATALQHDLELVTGNVRHLRRVPGLRLSSVLADSSPD